MKTETVLETFDFNGVTAEAVEWAPSLRCGFSSVAADYSSEPDAVQPLEKYRKLPLEKMIDKEEHRDACLSFNYLSEN